MALLKGRDVQQQQMYQPQPQPQPPQQPEGRTRRQIFFRRLKIWTLFIIVCVLFNAYDSWSTGYPVVHSFTGGAFAWFLGLMAIGFLPVLEAHFNRVAKDSERFWNGRD